MFSVETTRNFLERFFTPEVVFRLQYTLLEHCLELLISQHFHSYPKCFLKLNLEDASWEGTKHFSVHQQHHISYKYVDSVDDEKSCIRMEKLSVLSGESWFSFKERIHVANSF
jgi:hypothetical protein